MSFFSVFILSLVESIAEFFPISSTAHLIFTSHLLGITSDDFLTSFEIFIQLGAICAVLVFFFSQLWHHKYLWKFLIAAFIPMGLAGFLLYDLVTKTLFSGQSVTGFSLIAGGVIFIIFFLLLSRSPNSSPPDEVSLSKRAPSDFFHLDHLSLSFPRALLIGLGQCLSLIPGVSRSAATILSGSATGLSLRQAVNFSFLLAIPTIFAASGYDLFKTFYHQYQLSLPLTTLFSPEQWLYLAAGFIITFVFSLLFLRPILTLLFHHRTWLFLGIYRLLFGILWLIVV